MEQKSCLLRNFISTQRCGSIFSLKFSTPKNSIFLWAGRQNLWWTRIFRISDPFLQPHKEFLFLSLNRGKILLGAARMDLKSKDFSSIPGAVQRIYLSLCAWRRTPVRWFRKRAKIFRIQFPSSQRISAPLCPLCLQHFLLASNWLSGEACREDCKCNHMT